MKNGVINRAEVSIRSKNYMQDVLEYVNWKMEDAGQRGMGALEEVQIIGNKVRMM